jgi:hypothetical protein
LITFYLLKCFLSINILPNKLGSIVKDLAKSIGLDGKGYSAHSLRAQAACTLTEKGASQSSIMDTTGHRSIAGLRAYQHSTVGDKLEMSKLLTEERIRPGSNGGEKRKPVHIACQNKLKVVIRDLGDEGLSVEIEK